MVVLSWSRIVAVTLAFASLVVGYHAEQELGQEFLRALERRSTESSESTIKGRPRANQRREGDQDLLSPRTLRQHLKTEKSEDSDDGGSKVRGEKRTGNMDGTTATDALPSPKVDKKENSHIEGEPTAVGSIKRTGLLQSNEDGNNGEINIGFFHLAPIHAVPVAADDAFFQSVSTVFIYSGALFRNDTTPIVSSGITGTCRKLQQWTQFDMNTTLLGGGMCSFTYTLEVTQQGLPMNTLTVKGELFDLVGGVLSIVGGTGVFESASGQVEVVPLYENNTFVDVFTEANTYLVNATIIL